MGRRWAGSSLNVSTLGMCLLLEAPLELRGLMFVSFNPGDRVGPLWTQFSLVRSGARHEYGIRFIGLPPKAAERLRRLIEVPETSSP